MSVNLDIAGAEASKAEEKLKETTGAAKTNILRGYEGIWVGARRNNWCYMLNKIISMGIAGFFAVVTLYGKLMAMRFIKTIDEEKTEANIFAASHMQNMFWLMFIYLCM
jgi:hypothetical protein